MKRLAMVVTSTLLSASVHSQTGVFVPQMAHCDTLMSQFLSTYDIPGASMAISKDGKLIYSRAFGNANLAQDENTNPHHLMRVASISKPITSVAVMKLVESGQISLSDKVFGTNGIFSTNTYFSNANISDQRVNNITIRHLLEHSGGWDRDVPCIANESTPYPWTINHCDPIGFPLHVVQTLGEANPVTERAMVKFLVEKGLNFTPGSQFAYSNIGYLLLGLVIEEVTGISYEQYVKTNILEPVGALDMHLGNDLLQDKQEREAEYFGNGFTAPTAYGTGNYVPWEYGGWSIEAMDAHGGWIATARDLVRLLGAVDNFSTSPDILTSSSISTMTTPGVANYYAKGWSVNSANNWWHTGSLDGTASIWVRASAGFNWAVLLNKRSSDSQANAFWGGLDGLPWNCLAQTASFPAHDLFGVPKIGSSNLSVISADQSSITVSWLPGDGDKHMLVASHATPVTSFPVNGTDYTASSQYGLGDELANQHYIVYNGAATSVTISGLIEGESYYFKLFDYNQNNSSGGHALYQSSKYQEVSGTTATGLTCNGLTVTVNIGQGDVPTNGHDVILGTESSDVIYAMDGDDVICGLGGNDTIFGGDGRDTMYGDEGEDFLDGGRDKDTIWGGADNDVIKGGAARDTLHGDGGDDKINGNGSPDTIYGGAGIDTIKSGGGNDIVYGGADGDVINGGKGDDEIHGEGGDDDLKGGSNNDDLYGGEGMNDVCNGSGGADTADSDCETVIGVP